jgi:thiosulfate reductase cytochrome b subunit
LRPRLHAGKRLVSVPGPGPEGPHLDRQGRFRHAADLARHPGLRHTLGLSRWWHFSINLLWLINGIAFYALLFSTDQWRRLVPLTWEVFPAALSTTVQYASLNFPVDEGWTRYNGLQQLSYFITVFGKTACPFS